MVEEQMSLTLLLVEVLEAPAEAQALEAQEVIQQCLADKEINLL